MLHGTPALQHNEVGVSLSVGWPLTAGGQQFDYPQSPQTGPTHGYHQCGIKPTGLDSVSPYISSLALHTLETPLCLYTALLFVELTLP
jgi:hypothetical protein